MPISDDELAAALAADYEAQQRSTRNREAMNRLIGGQPLNPQDDNAEPEDSPTSMNDLIRKAIGRPYKTTPSKDNS